MRLQRIRNDSFVVEYADSNNQWQFMRIAHLQLPSSAAIDLGAYACSPKCGKDKTAGNFLCKMINSTSFCLVLFSEGGGVRFAKIAVENRTDFQHSA